MRSNIVHRVGQRWCMRVALAAAAVVGTTSASHAWLGSFEGADGYRPFLDFVQSYNAGQHGANSGYVGAYTPIPPNTGLWTAVSGGFFSGGAVSYATGHQNFDRQWVNNSVGSAANQGLVVTTGHEGWGGPACKYRYSVDSSDLGGITPAASGNYEVKLSFWNMGQLAGTELGGQVPNGYYGNEVAFEDGSGNVGFSLGLTQRPGGDRVTYWNGSTMFESTMIGSSSRFDRWDLTLDLFNDTVSATYFNFLSSTTTTLFTGVPMMSTMSGLSGISFRSSDGVSNNKIWAVDDFSFTSRLIPTPGTAMMFGAAGLLAMRRRRA